MGDATLRGTRFRSLDEAETLRNLAHRLREGIYITDVGGNILDANPAFLEIFGVRSLEELESYRAGDLLADPTRRQLELQLLDRDGAVREFELEIIRPDGQRRTVLDTTFVCQDDISGERMFHGILVDITRRKELEDQLREQSIRDALTGCYNRRYLFELGAQLTAGAKDTSWGCIYIDVDHFKQFNDLHGHERGDRMLIEVSRFLMRQVRADEPVIRLGGDEFIIVIVGEAAARTDQIATRLRDAASAQSSVAFSLGWAIRAASERFERTINRADQHLVDGRAAARGRVAPPPANGRSTDSTP
jgi:diguanylate cyclase (GGDEF)-like protein/PAS domain S-box-containing protein